MKIFDKQAHYLDRVAAVQEQEGCLSHILLNTQPYLLLPVSCIETVKPEGIYLKLDKTALKQLQ